MLQYSYTYGLVISGEMKNAHTNIANYISNNRQQISQLIENTTPKFSVGEFLFLYIMRSAVVRALNESDFWESRSEAENRLKFCLSI